MYGHLCEEPIRLVCSHPYYPICVVCTGKLNLTILDHYKNRSLRNFCVPSSFLKENNLSMFSSIIGLFFIDNISNRCYQSFLSSTQSFSPSDSFISLVFNRGIIMFDQTCEINHYFTFDFTAISVCQSPDSLIISDNSGCIYLFSFFNQTIRKIYNSTLIYSNVFLSHSSNDYYGIVCVSSNIIELITPNGQQCFSYNFEGGRFFSFDLFRSKLLVVTDKRVVRVFSISSSKIESLGDCNFSGITLGDTKPTNYNVQQVCSSNLPISPQSIFYSICDQNTLFVCNSNRQLLRIDLSRDNQKLNRINCSYMFSHLTNPSVLFIVSENNLLVVDVFSYIPQICESNSIPKSFLTQSQELGSIFTFHFNESICSIFDHNNHKYSIYDNHNQKIIYDGISQDVIIGPNYCFCQLVNRNFNNNKKQNNYFLECFERDKCVKSIEVPNKSNAIHQLKLLSFGPCFCLIFGEGCLDLSSNPQKEPHTTSFIYLWETYELASFQIDDFSSISYEFPYLVASSSMSYCVYKIEKDQQIKSIVRRFIRTNHVIISEGKVYGISSEGLFVDDFESIQLISSRFSHVLSSNSNINKLPIF